MKRLVISNFKGIGNPLQLDLSEENGNLFNLLLYAENGGGKTSIAEAIRLISFSNELENEIIASNIVGEERIAVKKDWLNSYLHNPSKELFEIEIDGFKFTPTDTQIHPNINTFILGRSQLIPTSKIKIENIIGKTYFKSPFSDKEIYSPTAIELVLDEVNQMLENDFKESFRVLPSNTNEAIVGITGVIDGTITENIHKKLNEAHQNLIKILIFIAYLKLLPKPTDNNPYFVIFDDIMSSLDLANRIILARTIINLGKTYQLLVMTHNVGFYNLVKHLSSIHKTNESWKFASLYKIDDEHTISFFNEEESVDALLNRYNGNILPTDESAVNAMRKKFEKLLHEFGKILVLGVQEETSYLIDKICNIEKGVYCCIDDQKISTHFDLIKKISSLVNVCPQPQLQSKIRSLLQKYNEENQLPWISETIRHLQTYQKVILHQGSHDQAGTIPVISTKEITITLDLMRKLELITRRNSTSFPYFI